MDAISNLDLIIYIILAFFASFLSSVSGGGGGFVTTPLLILLGLSPAQAVSTGKISGIAIALGSIAGLRKGGVRYSKKQVLILCTIALLVGLTVPYIITNLNSDIYQKILGTLLILMVPVIMLKKIGDKTFKPSKKRKITGYFLTSLVFLVQGVSSTGVGMFVNVVLMSFLGLKNITANIVKRYSQLILNVVIVSGILFSDLIIWKIALISLVINLFGGYLGGKFATKLSAQSIRYFFVTVMFLSGIALILA